MDEFTDYSEAIKNARFISPTAPNVKLSFGGPIGIAYHCHSDKIPNRFQRWMLMKVFGIKVEELKEENTCI
jgi:hypothetical protein